MISCTEFIPAYSELFSWLEEHYGREEVDRFWIYLFKPDGKGIPLINHVKKEGVRGCFSYWSEKDTGYVFAMESYDAETGAASYRFEKK